jgi:two-component system sensor histidine kinase RstB
MKSIYLRSIVFTIPIVLFWFLLTSWLYSYTEFDPAEYAPSVDFKIVRKLINQQISQDAEVDYKKIYDIDNSYDLSVTTINPIEFILDTSEQTEITNKGYFEFIDMNNSYSQVIWIEEPDLLLKISENKFFLLNSVLSKELLSLILLITLVSTGLYLALYPLDIQLKQIFNNLSLLNKGSKVDNLNNLQIGKAGDIARELDKLTDNLNKLVDSRTSLLVAHQDLLHGVAHEFRSPIARLHFAVEMLSTAKSDVDADSLYEDICTALEEMEQLVKEVLQYSRLQHGDVYRELSTFSMVKLVRSVIAKQKSHTPHVAISSEGEDVEVKAIEHLLERAIFNLVRNACHFAQRKVVVSWQLLNNVLQIKVADDGIGIPPGKRELIFEPFTRLDPSRSRESGGVGLGLSIAKSICIKHQGTITAGESSLGGAEFCICIPKTDKD